VLGFLAAVGLGRLIVFALVLGLGGGVAFLLGRHLRNRGLQHATGAVRAAGRVGRQAAAQAGTATRRPVEGLRKRSDERRERSAQSRRPKDAQRLNAQGVELRRKGEPEAAVAAHAAALDVARAAGDQGVEALTLNNLGLALAHAGNEQAAIDHFDAAVGILREIQDEHHEGQVLANLGFLHGRRGRREQAVYCLEAALGKLDRDSRAFRHVEEQLQRAS
jgi:tetratricopeptide (TPR) repeat protein